MKTKRNAIANSIAAAASATILVGGALANAAPNKVVYEKEVQSCISEVGRHADYDEATRVRHTVVLLEETRLRYKFSIGTSVYTDSDEIATRKYTAYCVVLGDGTPVKFSIENDVV